MAATTIHDWTESSVLLKGGEQRDVKYRVCRNDAGVFQEICETGGQSLYTLEIPDGMKLEKNSYEVMLRYVLLDLLAA